VSVGVDLAPKIFLPILVKTRIHTGNLSTIRGKFSNFRAQARLHMGLTPG
jgi:hypothetical protein